jgi:hypothetical protein
MDCSENIFFLLLPNFTNHCHLLFTFSQFLFYDYSMSLGIFYKGDATTSTIVHESTIFTINVQLSTIIVTVFLIVTIIVDKCT